ncbi:D-arabinono-1,4-lactone oxidase [Chondrinema litorale]|uniref:D-arabinono-1,4-lactone oxidase n=1 Tax=Chondrinema litorale TaxID=2994555 RepID=UPI0025427EE4|nr:D-arabinono-1,4-lactone oxidase [Chondrinema litorale]UZR96630.1 FAD-binding protein [Chondrinema litorale]
MKRKQFLKTSSTLVAGSLIAPMISCNSNSKSAGTETTKPEVEMATARTNWAGNYTYKAPKLHTPESVEELQELVKTLDTQKALGSKHCFNNIADSPLNQISTEKLNKVVSIDKDAKTVTVESGIRYGDLANPLDEAGFALHNLASLPHISVVGACATATHGSGVKNGNLSSAVVGLELITPSGELVKFAKGDPEFNGVVVNIGALGIISRVTLEVEDTYQVRQDVLQELPLASAIENFEAIMSAGYSVSLFTDWLNDKVSQVWVKRKVTDGLADLGNDYYGAKAATKDLHPITALSAENCTAQMGVAGPWYERLPHFKMGFTPSSGDELQSEFFVPMENAVEALKAIEAKKAVISPHLFISEIRSIAADELWLSPAYKKDIIAFHFTWKPRGPEVNKLLPVIEQELAPFGVVPHWGKLFTINPEVLHSRYEKMEDFLNLTKKYDPEGKFRNAYLDKNLYV